MAWWAALASLGAGLMSAQTQAAASREGAEAQYKALMESLGLQREMYEYARHQAQPYYQYGLGGLQRMSRMPTYQGAINALSSFQDPLYGRGAIYSGGYNALRNMNRQPPLPAQTPYEAPKPFVPSGWEPPPLDFSSNNNTMQSWLTPGWRDGDGFDWQEGVNPVNAFVEENIFDVGSWF